MAKFLDGGIDVHAGGKSEAIIQVDGYHPDGQHCFFPGQRVTGRVLYVIRKPQEDLRDLTLVFDGEIQTHIVESSTDSNGSSSNTHYRETISLFSFIKPLYGGNYTVRAQTFSWPFEFRFPETAAYIRLDQSDSGLSQPGVGAYMPNGTMRLPASYRTNGLSRRGDCHVEYRLTVLANASSVFHQHKWKMELLVRGDPPAKPLPPPVSSYKMIPRVQWQSRTLRETQHTFRQKLAHVFGNDPDLRTPTISFDAWIDLPSITSVSQRSNLVIYLKHVNTGPTDPENPALGLKSVSIALYTSDKMRVGYRTSAHSRNSAGHSLVCAGGFQDPSPAFERNPLPLDGSPYTVATDWCLADLTRPGGIMPDFSTWTIVHSHMLKVKIEVVHLDSDHIFKLKEEWPLCILPENDPVSSQQFQTRQINSIGPVNRTMARSSGIKDVDEPLPAYAAVEGS